MQSKKSKKKPGKDYLVGDTEQVSGARYEFQAKLGHLKNCGLFMGAAQGKQLDFYSDHVTAQISKHEAEQRQRQLLEQRRREADEARRQQMADAARAEEARAEESARAFTVSPGNRRRRHSTRRHHVSSVLPTDRSASVNKSCSYAVSRRPPSSAICSRPLKPHPHRPTTRTQRRRPRDSRWALRSSPTPST